MTTPPNKTIHSEYPEKSDSLPRDLENHIKDILQRRDSPQEKVAIEELFAFMKKHRLDIESQCKKNGWMVGGLKDYVHSLDRSMEFTHEYITNFSKDTSEHLLELLVESTEEVLFFLNNES